MLLVVGDTRQNLVTQLDPILLVDDTLEFGVHHQRKPTDLHECLVGQTQGGKTRQPDQIPFQVHLGGVVVEEVPDRQAEHKLQQGQLELHLVLVEVQTLPTFLPPHQALHVVQPAFQHHPHHAIQHLPMKTILPEAPVDEGDQHRVRPVLEFRLFQLLGKDELRLLQIVGQALFAGFGWPVDQVTIDGKRLTLQLRCHGLVGGGWHHD